MRYADMTPREAVCFAEGGNAFPHTFVDNWEVESEFFSKYREEPLQDAKRYAKDMRSKGYTVKRKSLDIGVSVTAVKKRKDNG